MPSFNPKWGHISASSLIHISANENLLLLYQEMWLAASQDLHWLMIYALEKCVSWEALILLDELWSHISPLCNVHVHHIMVREVSWATSLVYSSGMSNDQEAYRHIHAHTFTLWPVLWVIMMSEGGTDWALIPSLSTEWIMALEVVQASSFPVFHFPSFSPDTFYCVYLFYLLPNPMF